MYDDIKESINKEDNIETNTNKYIQILKKATTHLTHLTPKEKDVAYSDKTNSLLEQRGHAINKGNLLAFESLRKTIQKKQKRRQNKRNNRSNRSRDRH